MCAYHAKSVNEDLEHSSFSLFLLLNITDQKKNQAIVGHLAAQ